MTTPTPKPQDNAAWLAYLKRFEPKNEFDLQCQLVRWCREQGKEMVKGRFHASPNGAHLAGNDWQRARQAQKLKASGMNVGWPDLQFYKGSPPATLFLELKFGKGRLSPEQKEMHAQLIGDGFPVLIIRTLEEGRAAITSFYAP